MNTKRTIKSKQWKPAHIDEMLSAIHNNEWHRAESILADIVRRSPQNSFKLVPILGTDSNTK